MLSFLILSFFALPHLCYSDDPITSVSNFEFSISKSFSYGPVQMLPAGVQHLTLKFSGCNARVIVNATGMTYTDKIELEGTNVHKVYQNQTNPSNVIDEIVEPNNAYVTVYSNYRNPNMVYSVSLNKIPGTGPSCGGSTTGILAAFALFLLRSII